MNDLMAPENITEYLHKIVAQESALFTLTKEIEELEKVANTSPGSMCEKKEIPLPNKRNVQKGTLNSTNSGYRVPLLLFLGSGVLLVIGLATSIYILASLSIPTFFIALIAALNQDKENQEKLEEEYQEQLALAEQQYEQEMQAYQIQKAEEDERYYAQVHRIREKLAILRTEANRLSEIKRKGMEILSQLYNLDIIYPKYRNYIAVCTLAEYFSSGRCSELTGPNGAYNLYESELRQNTIINQMDIILRGLETIRLNQYILYEELYKTNSYLPSIRADISGLLDANQKTEQLTGIAAAASRAIAANTEATAYYEYTKR